MINYQLLLHRILKEGVRQSNRTGIDTLFIPGAMLEFDMANGFPAVTTKELAFNAVKGELVGFIRGYDNAKDFRDLGCKIWDDNANKNKAWINSAHRKGEDDLGRIYGVQWRRWNNEFGEPVDQLASAVDTILHDPTNRRIIINAWRPDELWRMALPPCHILYQFICDVEHNLLHLCMYQRSCDMFLGVPFNIASSALLLHIVAKLTGYTPGKFTHFLADAHIYVNHVDQVKEQLSRVPLTLPEIDVNLIPFQKNLTFSLMQKAISCISPNDIRLEDYNFWPAIKAPMAV